MTTELLEGYRVSPQQKYLWLLQKDAYKYNESNPYCTQLAIKIQDNIQENILKQTLEIIVNRHSILRTKIRQKTGIKIPIQVIEDQAKILWIYLGKIVKNSQIIEQKIEEIFLKHRESIGELYQEFLLQASLLTISEKEHFLILSMPSLYADNWSIDNIVKEINQTYIACLEGEESEEELEEIIQYLQVSEWQNELLEEKVPEAEIGKKYWKQQEENSLPPITLPLEKKQIKESQETKKSKFNPKIYSININPESTKTIEEFTSKTNINISDLLLTSFQVLLSKITGKWEFPLDIVCSGREYEELQDTIGLVAKTLPLNCELSQSLEISQIILQTQQIIDNLQSWQEYFVKDEISKNHSKNNAIAYEYEEKKETQITTNNKFSLYKKYNCIDQFKIKLNCIHQQNALTIEIYYDPELFSIEEITQLVEHFQTIITNIIANPFAKIKDIEILSQSQINQQIVELNNTKNEFPQDKLIHQLIETQAIETPQNIAIIWENQHLTYQELNQQANQLANYLIQQGIKPDNPVVIYTERSPYTIIAMLSILKAGGAYVIIDSGLPTEALNKRIEDTNTPIIITQESLINKMPKNSRQLIYLDKDWEIIENQNKTNPNQQLKLENLAYVLYTSGSTGKPKGVLIEHRQILNYTQAIIKRLEIPKGGSYATVSTFAADLGNTVIFPALCNGGTLHIITQETATNSKALAEYFQQHPIDYLKIVPSHLAALLSTNLQSSILPREKLILGGETTTWELIQQIQQHQSQFDNQCRIFNHYGPTETTVGVTTYPVTQSTHQFSKTVPLGRPLDNTQVYILSEEMKLLPLGMTGEIYLGGVGLARGYLNQPGITAERFIEHHFKDIPHSKLYKTGDRGRYLPDGNIEFIGRTDNQVKIRGFRIELGEIETILNQHPMIKQNVVILREDIPGNKRLVAYIVAYKSSSTQDQDISLENKFRNYLLEKLPQYFIPSNFVILNLFPLTPNGKIDRKNLPSPESSLVNSKKEYISPRTTIEKTLASIWEEILEIKRISIHDNFFELGGHSLQGIKLVSKISIAMNLDISVRILFLNPTIAQLGEAIGEIIKEKEVSQEKLKKVTTNKNQENLSPEILQSQEEGSKFIQVEHRSLLSLIISKKIPRVDAVALTYFPNSMIEDFENSGINKDEILEKLCEKLPSLGTIISTHFGKIGIIYLPQFASELYNDQKKTVSEIIDALEIASQIGARTVSLTGLIPSATDYGLAITKEIENRFPQGSLEKEHLPKITTGHGTTSACIVLTIKKILSLGGGDMRNERVGFIGIGSVGTSALSLMLKSLPHPKEIILCDLYSKIDFLEEFKQELIEEFDFRGDIQIILSKAEVPNEIYNSTLIVGATNVANILDIAKIKPGTMIVDDSAPHCFPSDLAIERFEKHQDILFTEGGALKPPQPIHRLRYVPAYLQKIITSGKGVDYLKANPFSLMGCGFSSLLSSLYENLPPTLGSVDLNLALENYKFLNDNGFEGADLHCQDYLLSEESIKNFRNSRIK